MDPKQI